MNTCDICCVEYNDNLFLRTNPFMCRCKYSTCVACITNIALKNLKVTEIEEVIDIEITVDPEINCPFCRREMPQMIKSFYTSGPLFDMILMLNACKKLGKIEEAETIQKSIDEEMSVKKRF
jgi:hypothetical protein